MTATFMPTTTSPLLNWVQWGATTTTVSQTTTGNTQWVTVPYTTLGGGSVYPYGDPRQQLPTLSLGAVYQLPDGSVLDIDAAGNYRVLDDNARVTYQACRVREFNRFINASDLLEQFIREMGSEFGVRQDEVLSLPVNTFIHWLLREAAKKDGDPLDELPPVESTLPQLPAPERVPIPRCGQCGRFIRRAWAAARIAFCSPEHMRLKMEAL